MSERYSNALVLIAVVCAVTVTGLMIRRELSSPYNPVSLSPVELDRDDWRKMVDEGHQLIVAEREPSVTVVYFTDYECPYCIKFETSSLPGVLADYPGQVNVIMNHWPLPSHPLAYPAARAIECAGYQGRVVAYHHQLIKAGPRFLNELAVEAGIQNLAEFGKCVADTLPVPKVENDIVMATSLGGAGTPLIAIDGILHPAAPDSARFGRLIREVMNK